MDEIHLYETAAILVAKDSPNTIEVNGEAKPHTIVPATDENIEKYITNPEI